MEQAVIGLLETVPRPEINEEHLCPCYEQLNGAAYSLIMAERHGVRQRNLSSYHENVRLKLPELLQLQ